MKKVSMQYADKRGIQSGFKYSKIRNPITKRHSLVALGRIGDLYVKMFPSLNARPSNQPLNNEPL